MKRLLIADDERLIRHLIRAALEAPGFAFDEAADGIEALALLDAASYDLIISDLHMPRLDGLGLLAAARQRRPDQPFVLVSASFEVPPPGRDQIYFMGKPFELDALTSCVAQALTDAPESILQEA